MGLSPFRGYFKQTRSPIYSAAMVLPFFLIYHIGTLFLHTTYMNGADALIIRILRPFSVNTMFASALVLFACFVIWQVRTKGSWTIDIPKLFLLYFESLAFAVLLLFFFNWSSTHRSLAASQPRGPQGPLAELVLYCGAGIYEELVFRGFLLGGLLLIFKKLLGLDRKLGAVLATLTAALIFSLFHYIGPIRDPFTLASFLQRALGGVFFSALFVTRGFGVTATTHTLYDILVGLIVQ